MSSSVRQVNLFAAESWETVYRSFRDVSFRSYDFETIRDTLIEYVQKNLPEFNDYIASSEYIAMIELLAWVASTLAFRVDLNSRENFLDTAERRESIVRLARMLSYQPKRNIPARGLLKITAAETNEPVRDSRGRQLNRSTAFWNDPNNPDSFEQFIAVMNAAFSPRNPFGRPLKSGLLGAIDTQLYRFNADPDNTALTYATSARARGERVPLDLVNVDFEPSETFRERHPNPVNPFHVVYRNDGEGPESANTGFFLYFHQGVLQKQDFALDQSISNRTLAIDAKNVNEMDVYVQEINEQGEVLHEWTRVPALFGENIAYNGITPTQRKIFSVISGVDDEITVRFGDGNFGEIPVGLFRVWYRTSTNRSLTIRPEDLQNNEVRIPYVGRDGEQYAVRLTFGLAESVNNSAPSETNDQIRERAPQVFYTQNRMVNGEDYNVFPLTQGSQIVKARALNRTHAGHSRFIDINDPTGNAQNTIVLGEDGALWADEEPQLELARLDELTEEDIADVMVPGLLRDQFLQNFFYGTYLRQYRELPNNENAFDVTALEDIIYWLPDTGRAPGATGLFSRSAFQTQDVIGPTSFPASAFRFLRQGSKIRFKPPQEDLSELTSISQWVTVRGLSVSGGEWRVELSDTVDSGWELVEILPPFRRSLTNAERDLLVSRQAPLGLLVQNAGFGLGYDIEQDQWYRVPSANIQEDFRISLSGEAGLFNQGERKSWLMFAQPNPSGREWRLLTRGRRYIFESENQARFFFDDNFRIVDVRKGRAKRDTIELLSCNTRLEPLLPPVPPLRDPVLRAEFLGNPNGTGKIGEVVDIEGTLRITIDRGQRLVPPITYRFTHLSGEALPQLEETTQANLDLFLPVTLTKEVPVFSELTKTFTFESVYEVEAEDEIGTVIRPGSAVGIFELIGTQEPPLQLQVGGCTPPTTSSTPVTTPTFSVTVDLPTVTVTPTGVDVTRTVDIVGVEVPGTLTVIDASFSETGGANDSGQATVNLAALPGSSGTNREVKVRFRVTYAPSDPSQDARSPVNRIVECIQRVTWERQAEPNPLTILDVAGCPTLSAITGGVCSGSVNLELPASITTSGGSGVVTTFFSNVSVSASDPNLTVQIASPRSSYTPGSIVAVNWSSPPGSSSSSPVSLTLRARPAASHDRGTVTGAFFECTRQLSWDCPPDAVQITDVDCGGPVQIDVSNQEDCSGTVSAPVPSFNLTGGNNPSVVSVTAEVDTNFQGLTLGTPTVSNNEVSFSWSSSPGVSGTNAAINIKYLVTVTDSSLPGGSQVFEVPCQGQIQLTWSCPVDPTGDIFTDPNVFWYINADTNTSRTRIVATFQGTGRIEAVPGLRQFSINDPGGEGPWQDGNASYGTWLVNSDTSQFVPRVDDYEITEIKMSTALNSSTVNINQILGSVMLDQFGQPIPNSRIEVGGKLHRGRIEVVSQAVGLRYEITLRHPITNQTDTVQATFNVEAR